MAGGFTFDHFADSLSYEKGELMRVVLASNDLTDWDFADKRMPDAVFESANLTDADMSGAKLCRASFKDATLDGTDFTGATLTDASFANTSPITDAFIHAIFTDAIIDGADFSAATASGFMETQFKSTGSYVNGEIIGVNLSNNILDEWDFAANDMSKAMFDNSSLVDAQFTKEEGGIYTGATLIEASFVDTILTGANFTNADLTDATFEHSASIANAFKNTIFTGATITGINLSGTVASGFSKTQFESTDSYISGDLTAVNLSNNDLTDWIFTAKNLTDARFETSILDNAFFTGANLTRCVFLRGYASQRRL